MGQVSRQESARTFSSGVLAYFTPYLVPVSPHETIIYAGILDTSRTLSAMKRKKKDAPIGQIEVLQL